MTPIPAADQSNLQGQPSSSQTSLPPISPTSSQTGVLQRDRPAQPQDTGTSSGELPRSGFGSQLKEIALDVKSLKAWFDAFTETSAARYRWPKVKFHAEVTDPSDSCRGPRPPSLNDLHASIKSNYWNILLTLHWYNTFQCFLIEQKVLFPGRKGRKQSPPCIDQSIVKSFVASSQPNPMQHPNLLDWSYPLTSSWNNQAIHLLCKAFKEEIDKGEHPQVPKDISQDQLVKWCISKLQCNRSSYLDSMPPGIDTGETAQEKSKRVEQRKVTTSDRNRRASRRRGVRCMS